MRTFEILINNISKGYWRGINKEDAAKNYKCSISDNETRNTIDLDNLTQGNNKIIVR